MKPVRWMVWRCCLGNTWRGQRLGRREIVSVSHAWETREHPDPCRFQLQNLADCAAAYLSDLWLFFDYTSFYQWQRSAQQELTSMRNVQVLYAHKCTLTFCMVPHAGKPRTVLLSRRRCTTDPAGRWFHFHSKWSPRCGQDRVKKAFLVKSLAKRFQDEAQDVAKIGPRKLSWWNP